MATMRKAVWFIVLAVAMAGWMGMLGSLRGVAEAGVIASHLPETAGSPGDLAKVQTFLENRIVVQMLIDYGVSPQEAMAKARAMSAQDLHRLASLTDRAAEGAHDGVGIVVGLAVLVILILVILMLMNKRVVIR